MRENTTTGVVAITYTDLLVCSLSAMGHRDLDMLDAADQVSDRVTELVDSALGRRMLRKVQILESAQSIPSNISEGFRRTTPKDRARVLRIARSEAEETIRHLGKNFRANRIPAKKYWPIHNKLVVIVRMINAFISRY